MSSIEYQVNIKQQNEVKEETLAQKQIRLQVCLANVLIFWAWTLNPEHQKLQEKLSEEYLKWLKPWDEVQIWLDSFSNGHVWIVFSNDWEIIKVKSDWYWNKKNKEWIRSFSTVNWRSKWFLLLEDYGWCQKLRFSIIIPDSHKVKSTRWIPKEAMDEINEIYRQAWDPDTCYDLVNNLKYCKPE